MSDSPMGIVELKQHLKELTDQAAHNDAILKRAQSRELLLLWADSLGSLLRVLVDGLRDSHSLEATGVVMLDPHHEIRHLLAASGERAEDFKQIIFVDSLTGHAPQLSALHKPWLGAYTVANHGLLFAGVGHLKSVALVPLLRKDKVTGVLCFGSIEAGRFTRHHGTDFLAHLGAVAAVCMENAVNRARLLRAGITDFLTGWHNRRYLQQRLKEELARAQRHAASISCLMIDIDHFKNINDGYGHLTGDNALKEVALRVESQIRSMDTAARFGGDEFAIILPEATVAAAATLAERIRGCIAVKPFILAEQISRHLSVSIGVAAVSPGRHETDLKTLADRLLADADAALYRAKALGRNRVQVGTG